LDERLERLWAGVIRGKAGAKLVGKVLLGTVKGDLHDIGKNLVKMMAQGAGIEVVDLGIDVSAEKFVQGLKDNPDARTIGMSALLTTTMTGMKEVIDRFDKEGLRKKVKFMVGGAPLTDQYAREIGADGYAPDAASAAERVCQRLFLAALRHMPYANSAAPAVLQNGQSRPEPYACNWYDAAVAVFDVEELVRRCWRIRREPEESPVRGL
jgi:cobalamin-dependent methionine synthase I